MTHGWSAGKLVQLARVRSGFAFKSSQWTDAGVPVVKIGNVKRGRLDMDGCSFVTEDDAVRSGFLLSDGDILVGLTGYVGEVAKVRNLGPLVLNQRVGKFYPTSDCDPEFLFFLVSNDEFRQRVEAASHGSAQANVSPSAIEAFEVLIPPLPEQRAIAATLGALDDKIELNRKMNATLEAMARALFRDWFVEFGPTRAKMEGRAPYLSPDIWSLFPDRLDDEGKPEGWEEKPLDEVADFLNGLALQKFPGEGEADSLPVIKIAELRNGITANSNRASRKVPSQYVIKDGDFLFSWSGSLLAKFWTGGEGALNQHLFKVTSDRYPAWFFSEWVQHHLEEFQIIAASKATTMGHIQRGHLKAAMTICPPDNTITRLGEAVAPLIHRIVRNELESRTLAQTRDLLLPRLMSGELRVAEAERLIGEVA